MKSNKNQKIKYMQMLIKYQLKLKKKINKWKNKILLVKT